ncbi:hypothetical protein DXN05_14190 [Deminuibacter soli]|uniref:Uncharacterized protein n=1 Tax=Deminuibacter soli TaxID=2291815 RepID=A0A3E1NIT3_9BACT|nr:hypothetical protein DXN05_14190 [Deminuibacter soli]
MSLIIPPQVQGREAWSTNISMPPTYKVKAAIMKVKQYKAMLLNLGINNPAEIASSAAGSNIDATLLNGPNT